MHAAPGKAKTKRRALLRTYALKRIFLPTTTAIATAPWMQLSCEVRKRLRVRGQGCGVSPWSVMSSALCSRRPRDDGASSHGARRPLRERMIWIRPEAARKALLVSSMLPYHTRGFGLSGSVTVFRSASDK